MHCWAQGCLHGVLFTSTAATTSSGVGSSHHSQPSRYYHLMAWIPGRHLGAGCLVLGSEGRRQVVPQLVALQVALLPGQLAGRLSFPLLQGGERPLPQGLPGGHALQQGAVRGQPGLQQQPDSVSRWVQGVAA